MPDIPQEVAHEQFDCGEVIRFFPSAQVPMVALSTLIVVPDQAIAGPANI